MPARDYAKFGCRVIPEFLPPERVNSLLAAIADYRNRYPVPSIRRESRGRALSYSVIDGERIRDLLPEITGIAAEMTSYVRKWSGRNLFPLADERVAVNVNITSTGGGYRWHYDRNAVTAIIFLNAVEGGETECYPNYRITGRGGRLLKRFQQPLDRLLLAGPVRFACGKKVLVKPEPGKLLLMRGDRCLHSVRTMTGESDRINLIMSYDEPGRVYDNANDLNRYLYESSPVAPSDPNYPS